MKTLLKIVGVIVLLVVVAAGAAYGWFTMATNKALAMTYDSHRIDIPMPWPLSSEEIAALKAAGPAATDADVQAAAMTAAVARGKHLVEARYGCTACHGPNFGGGEMMDAQPVATILGPNITAGKGGRTAAYTMADWDRIVRHGIKPDGHPAVMPSEDFLLMSDQELSDIVAFLRSQPTVDADIARPTFGPIGKMLVATGKFPLSASNIEHQAAHQALPPAAEPTVAFGKHLAGICSGCHRADFRGGPITFGPPDWPAAGNLTQDETGMKDWTFEDFQKLLKTGIRKNGQVAKTPMIDVVPYGQKQTEVEQRALWEFFRSLPPGPKHQ